MTDKTITTSLTVDRNNCIVDIGDGWEEQAKLGHAEIALKRETVISNYLCDFIQDDNTTMYIEATLSLCRVRKETLYRPYRCDSPSHKRFMELELRPLTNNQVQMTHFLLKEEPFQTAIVIDDITKTTTNKAASNYYLRCSMCNSVKAPQSDEWQEPETIPEEKKPHLKVIHTICEKCKGTIWHKR